MKNGLNGNKMTENTKAGLAASHLLTSHEVADMLQVNPSSINNWVKAGKLSAFRTPGGHRRLQAGSVAKFAAEYGLPIPEPLKGLTIPNILWVDSDAVRVKQLSKLASNSPFPLNVRVVPTLADGLIELGTHMPDAFILDATADDIPRGKAVSAARGRNQALIIGFVDGQLTDDDEEEISRLRVNLSLTRNMTVRQRLDLVLDEVFSAS